MKLRKWATKNRVHTGFLKYCQFKLNLKVMDNPLVSVILPVYNAQDYLKESIDCILNQSYENLEFIIINDGSKDNSEKIILSYSDPRIKYIYQDNRGLAETLNVGLS